MRLLFIVQGEGRGHLTQALAARAMLEAAGHEVTCVLAGSVRHRRLPRYFSEKMAVPVRRFASAGFSTGREHRSIRPLMTVVENLARLPKFSEALEQIDRTIDSVRPDLVLSFYEPMSGVYRLLYRPRVPFVAVGHQYLFEHSAFSFPPGSTIDRAAISLFTRLTAMGADWKLALSMYPAADLPEARLTVIPPLLRRELPAPQEGRGAADRLGGAERGEFFLIYLLNRGYAEQVIDWHDAHPRIPLHCFWDDDDAAEVVEYDDTLTFHRLDDVKFLELMARCGGLACTAGFESACEALFLRKPILAVPVEGHYEQQCNAREIELLGAGLRSPSFDLGRLLDFRSRYDPPVDAFRKWVALAPDRLLEVVERVAAGRTAPHPAGV